METQVEVLFAKAILPFASLIALGALWKWRQFGGIPADTARKTLNVMILNVTYPALVIASLSRAEIGFDLLIVPFFTLVGALSGAGVMYLILTRTPIGRSLPAASFAALLLAATFSNTIGVGIPVQQALFGFDAARYAIYADVLATLPLIWSLGVWVAFRYGPESMAGFQLSAFLGHALKLPPVWAFAVAMTMNLSGVTVPDWLLDTLLAVGAPTIPAMMLTVGLALPFGHWSRHWQGVAAASVVKLLVAPMVVFVLALVLGQMGEAADAAILEVAMPTVMASLMLADRFKLDAELLSTMIVATAVLFFGTLFLWMWVLL